jgi:hypothetical protein
VITILIVVLTSSDATLPPDEVKARIESIARISPKGEGPKITSTEEVIPPHHPQAPAPNNAGSSKSTDETTLISVDDDEEEDEFVDAHE